MLWRKRELTQFDFDYNATMVSLRMFPMRWVSSPWPEVLDNNEEGIHIWMGGGNCNFYFERHGRIHQRGEGLTGMVKTELTLWVWRMRAQCRRTMQSPHCVKAGPLWWMWQDYRNDLDGKS